MVILQFLCGILGLTSTDNDTAASERNWTCAHSALYTLARLDGQGCAARTLFAALPAKSESYTMSELADASQKLGIALRPTMLRRKDWPTRDAFIALVWRNAETEGHFLVIRPIGGDRSYAQLVDPPNPVSIIPAERLFPDEQTGLMALVQEPEIPIRRMGHLAAFVGILIVSYQLRRIWKTPSLSAKTA